METSTIIIIIAIVLIVMFFSGRLRGGRGPGSGAGNTPVFPGTRGPDRRDPPPGNGDRPADRGGDSPADRIGDAISDAGDAAKDAVSGDKPRRDRDDSVVDDIERDRRGPEKKHL